MGCIFSSNHYTALVSSTLIPLFVGIIMISVYRFLKKKNDPSKVDLRNRIFSAFLLMTFFVLPSVSIAIFTTFACREFDQDYGSFLKVDYSIDCNSSTHAMYQLFAGIMVLFYPVGIPLMYYLLLRNVRKKLNPGQKRLTYELGSEEKGMEEAIRLRTEFEEHDPDVKRLAFLYASYEPSCWWFEVAETMRRLTFTCGMVFFLPGTAAQISASMILCLGAMRIYAGYKPFVKESLDLLAETTQWQLYFTMFAALALKVDTSNESTQDNKLFDVVICLLQFAGPILVPLYRWYNREVEGRGGAGGSPVVEDSLGALESAVHAESSLELTAVDEKTKGLLSIAL
jgi:hypothetical protein